MSFRSALLHGRFLETRGGRASPVLPLFRHSRWDALLVGLAALHGAVLVTGPGALVIGLGVWWGSNTVSHDFIHKPFFRLAALNRAFGIYLTLVLGIPQSLWRAKHLAHHAEKAWRPRITREAAAEIGLLALLWAALALLAPGFFLAAYLPGLALGLGLSALHGHGEHAGGVTASHHGKLYNLVFLNDGYHAEHHAAPGLHWTRLPGRSAGGGRVSRWPPVLRWLDDVVPFGLEALERAVLRSRVLQRLVLASHERALRRLLATTPEPRSVLVVGGGLFPRTPLILEKLLPGAHLVVVDRDLEHLAAARPFLGERVELRHETFHRECHGDFDLVVLPLSFRGDRASLYRRPPGQALLVHDWLWRRRGAGAIVSLLLLKRLNLIVRDPQGR
jgi:hypothetical protein